MKITKDLANINLVKKDKTKLPAGAVVTKESVNVSVEEIENGFIVTKSFEINYTLKGRTDYMYYSKKAYFKENPIQIKEDKMLASYFD